MKQKIDKRAPTKNDKLISKLRSIIRDYREEHNSDAVIHSKQFIDFLISSELKKIKVEKFWSFNRKASFEEKLGFLLDAELITERLFDNCTITKGIRNPTEHHFSYPDKRFALGSITTAVELYYQLQLELDLPELSELNEMANELGATHVVGLVLKLKRAATASENIIFQQLVNKYSGPCICIVIADFTGKPSFLLPHKFGYSKEELINSLNKLGCIESAAWTTIPQMDKHPMLDSFPTTTDINKKVKSYAKES